MLLNQFPNSGQGLFERITRERQQLVEGIVPASKCESSQREKLDELVDRQRVLMAEQSSAISAKSGCSLVSSDSPKDQRPSRKLICVSKVSACSVPWNSMIGMDRLRWSPECNHFVYDPKGLSSKELEALIIFREGRKPNLLYQRADGTIVTCVCSAAGKQVVRFLPVVLVLAVIFVSVWIILGAHS